METLPEAVNQPGLSGDRSPATNLAEIIDFVVFCLPNPRFVTILSRRVLSPQGESLDSLGKQFGLTRERVRQLEVRARQLFHEKLDGLEQVTAVRRTLARIDSLVRPFSEIIDRVPALDAMVPSLQQPVWRVFEHLDGTFQIADGWWVRPSMSEAIRSTKAALAELADQHGIVPLDAVEMVKYRHRKTLDQTKERWLRHCGLIVFNGSALLRTGSVGDYTAALLSVTGEALSSAQIIQMFEVERSDRSLRNQLSTDDRFDRVDRDKWALHEWGMEVYSSIREEIAARLDLRGGSALLADLVEELTNHFSVNPTSVVAYATSPPFQCKDGVVSRATSSDVVKPPEKTARMFRVPEGWVFRLRITHEHLRGSGSPAPMAVTTILGLQFGQFRQLDSPLGPQSVYWTGLQPSFGTIRRFLLEYDIAVGAEAFVIFSDDGEFDIFPVRPRDGDPLHDALRLVHGPATDDAEEALQALARAIKLPDTATCLDLVEAYALRGDGDIAALLTLARDRLDDAE